MLWANQINLHLLSFLYLYLCDPMCTPLQRFLFIYYVLVLRSHSSLCGFEMYFFKQNVNELLSKADMSEQMCWAAENSDALMLSHLQMKISIIIC